MDARKSKSSAAVLVVEDEPLVRDYVSGILGQSGFEVIEAATGEEAKARIENMLGFLTSVTTWFDQMMALPRSTVMTLMKLGTKIANFIPKTAKES